MEYWFMAAIQSLRMELGFPLTINSGYRCSAYNATLPGSAPDSYHCQGLAADISTARMAGQQKHSLLLRAVMKFTGVGIYKTFIHVDLRPTEKRTTWTG